MRNCAGFLSWLYYIFTFLITQLHVSCVFFHAGIYLAKRTELFNFSQIFINSFHSGSGGGGCGLCSCCFFPPNLKFSMTQLQPLLLLLLIHSLSRLDIQQCGSISIWVAQCLGEFVLTKERQSTGQRLSSTSMSSWRANRTLKMKRFQTFTLVWRMWPPPLPPRPPPPPGSSCLIETLFILF